MVRVVEGTIQFPRRKRTEESAGHHIKTDFDPILNKSKLLNCRMAGT